MNSNIEWKQWGKSDPLYAVSSWDGKQKDGPKPWTDNEFYSLGASDWADFYDHWKRYGFQGGHCLEIGCGAGRITRHLANSFQMVTALDVSENMMQYASRNVRSDSVSFILTDGDGLPLLGNSVNAVFSTHVFQHFDSLADIAFTLQECYRVLRANGTLMVHLPLHGWPFMPLLLSKAYGWHQQMARLRANCKRALIRLGTWLPIMRYQSVDMDYVFDYLPKLGFKDVEVAVFRVQSNNHPHSFVLARK